MCLPFSNLPMTPLTEDTRLPCPCCTNGRRQHKLLCEFNQWHTCLSNILRDIFTASFAYDRACAHAYVCSLSNADQRPTLFHEQRTWQASFNATPATPVRLWKWFACDFNTKSSSPRQTPRTIGGGTNGTAS